MRLLLDTHAWIWMLTAPERFGATLSVIEDPANRLIVSAVTTWEIAIKVSLGRVSLPEAIETYLPALMDDAVVDRLPVDHGHAIRFASLPLHHRDPFDRMLIAQAQVERVPILTADRVFKRYDCDVVQVGEP